MQKLNIFTLGFSCLTGLGVLAFFYQLWASDVVSIIQPRLSTFESQTMLLQQSKAQALAKTQDNSSNQPTQGVNQAKYGVTLIDYTILPDSPQTAHAKDFLVGIQSSGYVGEHATFQRSLNQLSTYQILSNMLLMKEEALLLKTVMISPNMLNRKQLESSYDLTQRLLQDLKLMHHHGNCTTEQKVVMNVALSRLTYLTRMFSEELKKYES